MRVYKQRYAVKAGAFKCRWVASDNTQFEAPAKRHAAELMKVLSGEACGVRT